MILLGRANKVMRKVERFGVIEPRAWRFFVDLLLNTKAARQTVALGGGAQSMGENHRQPGNYKGWRTGSLAEGCINQSVTQRKPANLP